MREVIKMDMSIDPYHLMDLALEEAEKGFREGEIPVGAVIADAQGRVISKAHNRPIALNDPTAHAEVLALREAGALSGNYRIPDATLVVTIEPCVMCMGAALNARVAGLIFGAHDPKAGAAGSLFNMASDKRFNHQMELIAGIREKECRRLMQQFFRLRRGISMDFRRGTEVAVTGSTRNRLVP